MDLNNQPTTATPNTPVGPAQPATQQPAAKPAPAAPAASNLGPAARLKQRVADQQKSADAPKPEEKKDEKPVETPAAEQKPEEKKDEKPVDPKDAIPPLSPEEEGYVQKVLQEMETQEQSIEEVKRWSSQFHPNTQAWLDHHTQQRIQRLDQQQQAMKQAIQPTATTGVTPATATTPADGATGTLQQDQLVPITIPRPIRSVKDIDSPFEGQFLSMDNLANVLGIDPMKVPARYAQAFQKLIERHNRLLADATYFRGEGKQAYKKRDEARDALFKTEATHELEKAGLKVEGGLELVLPELRRLAFKDGVKKPWAQILTEAKQQYPSLLKLGTVQGSTGGAATTTPVTSTPAAPATPAAAPQGTRANNAPVIPATPPAPAKTFGGARANLARRVTEKQNKS